MNRIILISSFVMIASTAQADNYVVQYNLEGKGAALEKGSILLLDKKSTQPDLEVTPIEPPIIPPIQPPAGPVCSYNEEPSTKTMWVNGVSSYYKTFILYYEGSTIIESTNGNINPDTPKLVNGIRYSKGTIRFDGGPYPRYEVCVEKK